MDKYTLLRGGSQVKTVYRARMMMSLSWLAGVLCLEDILVTAEEQNKIPAVQIENIYIYTEYIII